MANTIRIKRRVGGNSDAPSSLENAELAFNETGVVLYYGTGIGGEGGSATAVIPVGGSGAFVALSGNQTIEDTKTFEDTIVGSVDGNAGTSNQWAESIEIVFTGDATATFSVDGSDDVEAEITLAEVNEDVGDFTKLTVNEKGLVTAAVQASLTDIAVPTDDFSFDEYRLTDLADPEDPTDAANKLYVDSVAQGLNIKASVVAGTTGNITLSGLGTQGGGDWASSLTGGNRVVVKNQTNEANNGLYSAASGGWARTPDADTFDKLVSAFVFVETGTTLADTGWVCTVDAGGTLGVTDIIFVQFSGAGTYLAGTGLTLDGNTFSITNTAVEADSYGAADETLSATVNAQGQLTSLSAEAIAITNDQVSGLGDMSIQDADDVEITGGSIIDLTTFDGITIDGGEF